MPSYADIAAQNAPPPELQPHPDPALLTTEPPSQDNIADDAAKLNIVSADFKTNPATLTSEAAVPRHPEPVPLSGGTAPAKSSGSGSAKDKARRYAHDAEEEGWYLWNVTKQYLFRPAVAGGLLGLVNVGLVSYAGYSFYNKPQLRRDTNAIVSTAAATLAILGAEGYAAEKYAETPAGREEARKAKEEGAALYRVTREHVLRPGVLGGLFGILNAGILGAVGYLAYTNWDSPRWDRRTVSAVSVGLLTLWTGEGYFAEQYRKQHH